MKNLFRGTLLALPMALAALMPLARGATSPLKPDTANESQKPDALSSAAPDQGVLFHPESTGSDASVTVGGQRIDYHAVAGTMIVHPKDWDDAAWREHPGKSGDDDKDKEKNAQDLGDRNATSAEASIFYVAYFKKGAACRRPPHHLPVQWRPRLFHCLAAHGRFRPRRVLTPGDSHVPAAPYKLVNNDYSLLDASDLVFIDAPGTGFSRIAGKDKEKAFYGVDPTLMPSASSFRVSCRNMAAGIHRNSCSAKAMARRATPT